MRERIRRARIWVESDVHSFQVEDDDSPLALSVRRGPSMAPAFQEVKRVNRRRGTSYGLKHVAEREIGYITNGVPIAAAKAEGFVVRRIVRTPNARIGISSAAWKGRR
jgi:hypothetical protein